MLKRPEPTMTAVPTGDAIRKATLAHEGLMETTVDGVPAILPTNSSTMLFGGVYEQSVTIQSPQGFSGVFLSSDTYTDFQIAGSGAASQVDFFDSMYLEFTVQNNDGANALKLPPAWYAFASIWLQVNGNQMAQYNSGQQLEDMYAKRAALIDHNHSYAQLGYPDATFAATGITIAASGSRTFLVPIHYLFPEWMKLDLAWIKDNVTLRFYWNAAAGYYWSTSASTTMSLTKLQIIAIGPQLAGEGSASLRAAGAASVVKIPCIIPQNRTFNLGALTATPSGNQITNLMGALSQVRMWVYDSPPTTPQGKQVTDTFDSWIFNSASGTPINQGNFFQYEVLQWQSKHYGKWMRVLPQSVGSSVAGAEVLKYIDQGPSISFCKEIASVVMNTSRHGAYSAVGSESISITGTYANGYVLAFFDVLGFVRIANGNVSYITQAR
jgi:hypothetical protein